VKKPFWCLVQRDGSVYTVHLRHEDAIKAAFMKGSPPCSIVQYVPKPAPRARDLSDFGRKKKGSVKRGK
jgi:hypothetical protein